MEHRIAIIDLGTNTFHLLIATYTSPDDFQILNREQVPVKIGEGGINEGHLTAEAYQRGMQTLQDLKAIMEHYQVENTRILATSALRNADNAMDFLRDTEALFRSRVEIIDGDEEATLIYKGVRLAVGLWANPSLILDIGGGSVEFIIGDQQQLYWKKSLEIGAARLIARFPHDFPMTNEQRQEIRDYLEQALNPLFTALTPYNLTTLVGASGFFETFINLDRHQRSENPDPEYPLYYDLCFESFNQLKTRILNSTKDELYNMPGMEAFRVEMMGVSTLLVELLLEKTGIEKIFYSNYAMKEGVLAEQLAIDNE